MRWRTSPTCAGSTRCWRSGSRRPAAPAWVEEELAVLTDPETYRTDPDDGLDPAEDPLDRAALPRRAARAGAVPRDAAQSRNVPRARILKDDALLELAANRPRTAEDLGKSRLLLREARRGDIADGILAAIAAAEALPAAEMPRADGAAGAQARRGGAGRPAAGAAEGAGRGRGGGAAAGRLERRSRRHRRRGRAGRAGAARLALRGVRPGRAAAEAGRDRAVRRRRRVRVVELLRTPAAPRPDDSVPRRWDRG